MSIKFKKASKNRIPIKLELFGPPGSGKTWSSLLIATGMQAKNICLIDTEQSAALYDEHFNFLVAEINPDDYKDQSKKLIKDFCDTFKSAIEEAKADCIIIDSLTHIWEAIKNYVNTLGGKYTDWAKGTPLWQQVIKMILSSPVPVIVCSRASYDDVIESKELNGKTSYTVKRLGTKADVRANSDYEFTTVFSLDMSHRFKCTKDRTGLFANQMGEEAEPRLITSEIGAEIYKWLNAGKLEITKLENVVFEDEPKINDNWKKPANKILHAIAACENQEEIKELNNLIEALKKDFKDLPKEAKAKLENALIEKTKEIELPY